MFLLIRGILIGYEIVSRERKSFEVTGGIYSMHSLLDGATLDHVLVNDMFTHLSKHYFD